MSNQLDAIAIGLLDQVYAEIAVAEERNWAEGERCFQRFILEESILLPGMALPGHMEKRPPRQCFRNAAIDVLASNDLIYCEGFATCPDISMIIHHAWAITPAGQVIDSTWDRPDLCVYMGVPVLRNYLWRWHSNASHKEEIFGTVLQDYDNKFPLINGTIAHSEWFAMHLIRKEIRDVSRAYRKGYARQSLRQNRAS